MLRLKLHFTKPGYIANPYWPEMFRLIEIQKQSGMMRVRSEKKRREALESHLRTCNLTLADFEQLQKDAARPFHMNGEGIYIPSSSIFACLVNASDEAPSKLRISNLRAALVISPFNTDKTAPDGQWERFVVVRSGTNKLSNQRGFRSSAYIENFQACGTIEHDAEMVRPQSIVDLMEFAGREIGIGASRKMGWGRFTVEQIR